MICARAEPVCTNQEGLTAMTTPGLGPFDNLVNKHPIISFLILDMGLGHLGKWALKTLGLEAKKQVQTRAEKKANRFTFELAMNELWTTHQADHDIIRDFMNHPDGLTNDTDREDFQHNMAKVGNTLAGTVVALRRFAAYRNHAARRVAADSHGYIGKRGVDPLEYAQNAARAAGGGIATAATTVAGATATVATTIRDQATVVADRIEASLQTPAGTNKATDFRNAQRDELKKLTNR